MAGSELLDRLERVVAEWATRSNQRLARQVKRESLAREDERSPARIEAEKALRCLRQLPIAERLPWLDSRSWKEEGVMLGCLLLEAAETLPPEDRIELPRLAARVSALADLRDAPVLSGVLDDNLGRAGLMEVRALRRRGNLGEARAMFAEIEAGFELEISPRVQLLTLSAERALTAGLLALDEYRTSVAEQQFFRCTRYLRVAGSEEDDAEVLFGQARLDLVRGDTFEAVDRLLRAAPFMSPRLRIQAAELVTRAALRTKLPSLARPPLTAFTAEAANSPAKELVPVLESAVRVLEARPSEALELLAGPQRRLRAERKLLPSLAAAVTAARAELALGRPRQARRALEGGVLSHFVDVPPTPAIQEGLSEVSTAISVGTIDTRLLDRVDIWLLLVTESPGVGMAPQA
jgi:hypothetical protein